MLFPRDKSKTTIEQLKTDYGWLMRIAHRALRRWETSGADIARVLEEDEQLFMHRFNPGNFEHGPSLWLFLMTIEFTKSREMASAVASLADCLAVPDRAHGRHRSEPQLQADTCAALEAARIAMQRCETDRGSVAREAAHRALLDLASEAGQLAQRYAGRFQ